MATPEEVIGRALRRIRETGELTIVCRIGIRPLPARQHLVGIALVGDVEDEFVSRGIEDIVDGYRGLDDTEVGTEMATRDGYRFEKRLTHLLDARLELINGESPYVVRTIDAVQIRTQRTYPSPHKTRPYFITVSMHHIRVLYYAGVLNGTMNPPYRLFNLLRAKRPIIHSL